VRQHVLLVEDSVLAADALRLLLEATGRDVTHADSVASACDALRDASPGVVLLDLTLPDGDGLDVARAAARTASPPVVIALTGHEGDQVVAACIDAGCAQVLIKPVVTRELLRILDGI
jgi:DNA-binding response OmpR family regulator